MFQLKSSSVVTLTIIATLTATLGISSVNASSVEHEEEGVHAHSHEATHDDHSAADVHHDATHDDHAVDAHHDDHHQDNHHDAHQDDHVQGHKTEATQQQVRLYADLENVPEFIRAKKQVTVSNYPLYLLSQEVTKGATPVKLLLNPGNAGHHSSLSPDDMKTIKDSRYVVWFGDALEADLAHALHQANNSISLLDINGFERKPLRDIKAQPIKGSLDPHIYLDPDNAKAITRALGAILARANPEFADVYAKNVSDFAKRMDNAAAQVQSVDQRQPVPYWAYHDAFQYIEPTLNLNLTGTLTADHHLAPKASQFLWLKSNRPQPTMCVVLLSDSNQKVLDKLQPVRSTTQLEDLSGTTDFISSWSKLANGLNRCARGTN